MSNDSIYPDERVGWIGVDLDGTLAEYHGWMDPTEIGAPIPGMVKRVQGWLARGIPVKIFTARMFPGEYEAEHPGEVEAAIRRWCKQHIGVELDCTCTKDYAMLELWDDRAVQVIPNTGLTLLESMMEEAHHA